MKHIVSLDSFRGIAAFSVLMLHLAIIGAASELDFFRHSGLFVPFFFVLSGFVIAYVYEKSSFNLKNFLIARSFRILPLYYTMFLLFIVLEFINLFCYHKFGIYFKNVPFTDDKDTSYILPNILLLQSWLPWVAPLSFNSVSWSLSVEWYLYLMFAVLMFLPLVVRKFAIIALVVLALVGALSFLTPNAISGISHFFAGCVTFWIFSLTKDRIANFQNLKLKLQIFNVLEFCAIALGFWVIYVRAGNIAIYVFCAIIFAFALSSAVFASNGGGGTLNFQNLNSQKRPLITTLLETRPLMYLGALSYSIYISHYFTISVIKSAMSLGARFGFWKMVQEEDRMSLRFLFESEILNLACANILMIFNLIAAILFAHFLHKFVEMPLLSYGKRMIKKN